MDTNMIVLILAGLVILGLIIRSTSSKSSNNGPIVGPSTGGVDTEVTDAFQFAGKHGAVVTGWVIEGDLVEVKINGATVATGSGILTTSVVGSNGVTYYRAAQKRQMDETYVYGVSYSTGSSSSSYTAEELQAFTKAELIAIGNTIGIRPLNLRPSWTKARMIEAILNH